MGDGGTYIPLLLKRLQIPVLARHALVAEDIIILLQQPAAHVRILRLRHRVLNVRLFEPIERNDNAIHFSEGVVEVPLGGREGKLDFLEREGGVSY